MRLTRSFTTAIALSAAAALALAGCSSTDVNDTEEESVAQSSTEPDYNPQPREALQQGGEASFGIQVLPPQMLSGNSDANAYTARLAAWYMPQVTLMAADGEVSKNDTYLDAWDIEEVDGDTQLTLTFTDEAHWNDGTDMDWTAVDTTWKTMRSYDEGYNASSTDGYDEIRSVEQGDTAKTAVVTFEGQFAWPDELFSSVFHPALMDKELFNEGFIDNPRADLGAGPYTIETFDSNAGVVVFEPNPEWWGNEPLLDKVTFTQLEANAAINAFKNGEIDMASTATADNLAQVAGMDGVVTYRAQRTANTLLQLDATKPQFADIEVRQAFFMAVNIDQQKQIAWQGLDYEEPNSGSFLRFSFQPGHSNSLEEAGWSYDPEGAKQLLDDAGWVPGSDGVREKDGVRLAAVYPLWSEDATQASLAQSIQASQKEIGIELEIDVRPAQSWSDDLNSKNWDVSGLAFAAGGPNSVANFCQIYCSDSALNLSGTGSEEIDARIEEVLGPLTTSEAIIEAAMKLEPEIMGQTWGIFPIYNGPEIYTVREGLANLSPEPYGTLDFFRVAPVEDLGWEK